MWVAGCLVTAEIAVDEVIVVSVGQKAILVLRHCGVDRVILWFIWKYGNFLLQLSIKEKMYTNRQTLFSIWFHTANIVQLSSCNFWHHPQVSFMLSNSNILPVTCLHHALYLKLRKYLSILKYFSNSLYQQARSSITRQFLPNFNT